MSNGWWRFRMEMARFTRTAGGGGGGGEGLRRSILGMWEIFFAKLISEALSLAKLSRSHSYSVLLVNQGTLKRTLEELTVSQCITGIFIWDVANPLYFRVVRHLQRPFNMNLDIIEIRIRFNNSLRRALRIHKCWINFTFWTTLTPSVEGFRSRFRFIMVHTRFSSVSRSPSECVSASKGKSKMSPKEVAMKKSKLKGKGKKTDFTIQDNMIPPPKYGIPVKEHGIAKINTNNKQLKQPNPLEIWIGIAGTKLRFGIHEFALITGLGCVGALDKKSSNSDSVIPKGDLDMLDSGDFDQFPWGREIYKTTLESLKCNLELSNLTATASEIKELKLEELFPTFNQRSVQENDNNDDDFVNPPTPLLRLSSSHSNAHEDNMSLVEMQRKLCTFETRQNNFTIEVNSLKTTMTEKRSYFESIFSNLQETIMIEVRRKNENDDDVLFDNYTGDYLSNPIHESFFRASFLEKDAPITKDFDQDTRGGTLDPKIWLQERLLQMKMPQLRLQRLQYRLLQLTQRLQIRIQEDGTLGPKMWLQERLLQMKMPQLRLQRLQLRQERKLHVIDIPPPGPLPEGATADERAARTRDENDANDVACLILATMSAELQRQHVHMDAYTINEHLQSMFASQTRQERFNTSKSLFNCKQGASEPVGPHVLKMIGYIEYLETLGFPIGPETGIDLIMNFLNNKFTQFVVNYNMNEFDKTHTELLHMLRTYKTNMKTAEPAPILMVGNKGKAKGKGKWKGKKKIGSDSTPKPKSGPKQALKPKGGVAKGECHYCKKDGHWKRNCPIYLVDLKKMKAIQISGSGIYVIEVNLSISTSWVFDTGCASHICINVQGLQRSRTLAKGEVDLRVGN
ncbi:hypothetical protein AgCh_030250 [Apium graveolens]